LADVASAELAGAALVAVPVGVFMMRNPCVVEDVANDEQEPGRHAQKQRHHLACGVVFRVLGVLPKVPVGWKQYQADGRDVLLEVEKSLRLPIAVLLNRNANVGAVLDGSRSLPDSPLYAPASSRLPLDASVPRSGRLRRPGV
jgi:hypothetical protein